NWSRSPCRSGSAAVACLAFGAGVGFFRWESCHPARNDRAIMTAAELRARLSAITAEPLPGEGAHGDDVLEVLDRPPVRAAVLVPIILGTPPAILLTKRNTHLSKHGGQVSFPGGRIDDKDPDPEAAALREAEEEIALDPSQVEILGRMADYVTGTG